MREDAECGPSVDQKTPFGDVVVDVDEIAGGDGVERPPDNQFPCQEQGASQLRALSPNCQ